MSLHPVVTRITDRIRARSADARGQYLERMGRAVSNGPVRAHLSCGNQAHAYAAMSTDKDALVAAKVPNLGIITAYKAIGGRLVCQNCEGTWIEVSDTTIETGVVLDGESEGLTIDNDIAASTELTSINAVVTTS